MTAEEGSDSAESIFFETIREPLLILDAGLRVMLVNPAFEATFQVTQEETVGRLIYELGNGQWNIPEFRRLLGDVLPRSSRVADFKVDLEFPNVGRRRMLLNARRILRSGSQVDAILLAIEDVTVRHEKNVLEEQLRQAQKVEALGKLAGGVAHDFNNLLTVICGYTQLSLASVDPASPLHANLTEVAKSADRAASLTRQLLAFGRRQMIQPVVRDLNALVEDVRKMLSRLIGEQITLRTALAPNLGRVRVDQGQIDQVLVNLVVNARDAMPSGGTVTIETANAELDPDYARMHVGVKPGSYVMLAVTDTGVGMSQETRAHLFEPFFTTKELGQGTGLGLATVYGIVKQHGGNIWVYSEPGRGTCFKIYLPRVDARTEIWKVETAAPVSPPGHETILLAEDDEVVRLYIKHVLQASGYTVLEARNGQEALANCTARDVVIDLVVSDLVMPGMGGAELGARLLAADDRIKILFLSGYTTGSVQQLPGAGVRSAFLEKPFAPDVLLRRIRSLLDGARGRG